MKQKTVIPNCYLPTNIDKKVGNIIGYTSEEAADLRARYDAVYYEDGKGIIDEVEDVNEIVKRLSEFERNANRIPDSLNIPKNYSKAYKKLRKVYTPEKRRYRQNFIAELFTQTALRISKETGYSLDEIFKGIQDNGKLIGGEFDIFNRSYNEIRKQYAAFSYGSTLSDEELKKRRYTRQKAMYMRDEFSKILDNWPALVTFARITLKERDGVILGEAHDYTIDADENNYGANDMTLIYTPEESTKESWQELRDQISAFGSLSKEVRRVLSHLVDVEYTEDGMTYKRDDLGNLMYIDALSAHQFLAELFTGMVNSKDMMNRLAASDKGYTKQLYHILNSDSQLRTKFFKEFNNNFNPYMIMRIKLESGVANTKNAIYKVTTLIKNKGVNTLSKAFRTTITQPDVFNSTNYIGNLDGTVDLQKLSKLRDLVIELFSMDTPNSRERFWQDKLSIQEWKRIGDTYGFRISNNVQENRIRAIEIILEAIGATNVNGINRNSIREILSGDNRQRRKFTDNIRELFFAYKVDDKDISKRNKIATGFAAAIKFNTDSDGKSSVSAENNGGLGNSPTYNALYNYTGNNKNLKIGYVKEKIEKLLNTFESAVVDKHMESRINYIDRHGKSNTRYSNVAPCFLGTMIEKINTYASVGDKKALRDYLTNTYKISSSFYLENVGWLNTWMEDLWNSDFADKNNFAAMISDDVFLGTDDQLFENFTEKTDLLSMMHCFDFSNERTRAPYQTINNMGQAVTAYKYYRYANYPVFILGDSGVRKTIKAKVYPEDEIIEGIYKMALSEIQKNKQWEAMNKQLENEGNKTVDHTEVDPSKPFKLLPFLNKGYKKEYDDIWSSSDYTSDDFKSKAKAIIKKELDTITQEVKEKAEKLGLLENQGNQYFSSVMQNYGNKIDGFIRDFAINTKFALLNQLQMMTIDVGYYKDTKDLQKRYKEIHAPGKTLDIYARNKFSENELFSENTDEDAPALESGFYFVDPQLDAELYNPEFMQAIKYQFGEDSEEYKSTFRKNALADGQGYRTLRGLRKVLGMYGEWTADMEGIYKEIKALRTYMRNTVGVEIPSYKDLEEWKNSGDKEFEGVYNRYMETLRSIQEKAVIFMPQKPYMYTFETFDIHQDGDSHKPVIDRVLIPVQHKYAEAILIPELMPDGMLKDMAKIMEDRNIDICGSWSTGGDKIVKVGGFGAKEISHVKSKEDLKKVLDKVKVHYWNYSDYRIQTNVPAHSNEDRLFGTQTRKLLMSYINKAADYSRYLDGRGYRLIRNKKNGMYQYVLDPTKVGTKDQYVNLNGNNLINLLNGVISANMIESFNNFKNTVSNPENFEASLLQSVINTSRQSYDNLLAFSLDSDGFSLPLFEGGIAHDAMALYWSLFKNEVNKQKIKGGSLVQVSAMGISGYKLDGNLAYVCSDKDGNIIRSTDSDFEERKDSITNVKWTECEVPFDLTVKTSRGPVTLDYDTYCNLDGTLKTDDKGNTIIEKEFPGILDRVAYRIPTEAGYSMMRLKVVRFSRPTVGGIIRVPEQGTTIGGFDFKQY